MRGSSDNPRGEGHEAGGATAGLRHCIGERVREAGDHLEHREIDVGAPRAHEELSAARAVPLEHALEVRQELRDALGHEGVGALLRGGLLVLVIEAPGDGVVGVVGLAHESASVSGAGSRRGGPARPPGRGHAGGEILEDVGRLGDHQLARLEEGRREREEGLALAGHELHHRRHPALRPRHVDIRGRSLLEGEPHEFAASLDRGPVMEL